MVPFVIVLLLFVIGIVWVIRRGRGPHRGGIARTSPRRQAVNKPSGGHDVRTVRPRTEKKS